MSPNLRFDNKVVVVTGAGGGLGRAYALAYAKLGAKVVVNDLGGSTRGEGASNSAADKVVEEIKAGGGEAVANYDSVTEGHKIIATAVQKYGRVDVLINNAGILRDVSFAKMQDKDWQLMNEVHLNGAYRTTKAAWEHMLKQKYGRIIMVTSAAGLYGNHGQSHYSAVKMGILGFANTLHQEGRSKNIHVNTIAPIAGSRMTATVMPEELLNALKPEYVVPLVLYLTAESITETGGLFEVGAGYLAKVRWQRSAGYSFPTGNGITPEQVAQKWQQITDYSTNPEYPTSSRDAFTHIMANIGNTGGGVDSIKPQAPAAAASSSQKPPAAGGKSKVNVELAKQHQFPAMKFNYTERDVILYALGIGAGADVAADSSELRWVYENAENFQVFPTFGVIPPSEALGGLVGAKGLEFNPMQLLHGEQKLHVLKPLPTSGTLTSHAQITDIWDKGSGAAVIMDVVTKDEQGQEVLKNTYTVFIRGLGGFSGNKGPASTDFNPPRGVPPTVVHRERTLPNQAVLYRLSGDLNPLHIDPDMAAMGNFPRPILHGLCSFGYATRAVIKHFADNDASKFQSIHVRFVKPVFPGETLVTSMWQVDNEHITFRVRASERGEQVLVGQVTLKGAAPASAASTSGNQLPTGTGFASEEVFKQMSQLLSPDIVQKVKAAYRFDLTKDGKTLHWLLDLKNGGGSITAADSSTKGDVSLAMSDDDFVNLISGKSDAQKMFMSGKIKFKGNIMLAQKLQLLKPTGSSKL